MGLGVLRKSLTLDTSIPFLNNSAPILLRALAAPDIADIDKGPYMHKLVECMVQPPAAIWGGSLCASQANQLEPDAQESFAWLLLQVVTLPDNPKYYRSTINPSIIKTLLNSPRFSVRSIAAKIKHVAIHRGSTPRNEGFTGPGGRHDNGHIDFVKFLSSLPPTNSSPSLRPSSDRAGGSKILPQRIIALPCTLTTSSVSCARIWLGS